MRYSIERVRESFKKQTCRLKNGNHTQSWVIRRVDAYFLNKMNDDANMKRGRKKVDILAAFQSSIANTHAHNQRETNNIVAENKTMASATLKENNLSRPSMNELGEVSSSKRGSSFRQIRNKHLISDRIAFKLEKSIKEASSINAHFSSRNSKPYNVLVR